MEKTVDDNPVSPYALRNKPFSPERVLLAVGFEHYCALHWGLSPTDIEKSFDGHGDDLDGERVRMAAELIGTLLARGAIRSWARPMGGGLPVAIPASAWELDDFSPRFATSAIDPKNPFDRSSQANHWIFADLEDWNAMLEASVEEPARQPQRGARTRPVPPPSVIVQETAVANGTDRFLRLPEVKHRTGLSRATIYRRMDAGTFPATVPLSGNVAAWREAEIAEWMRDPA